MYLFFIAYLLRLKRLNMIESILTDQAPTPGGHYSQAVAWNGLVFVAGQLPIKPSGEKLTGPIEEQAHQVLQNLKHILEAAGSGMDKVLKTTVYISDIELWGKVNDIYTTYFPTHKPARAIVPVSTLHYGFLIELEAVAVIG